MLCFLAGRVLLLWSTLCAGFMHAPDFLVALPTLSQVDRENLEQLINVPDLWKAVDSAAASRNPDLDGLSNEFTGQCLSLWHQPWWTPLNGQGRPAGPNPAPGGHQVNPQGERDPSGLATLANNSLEHLLQAPNKSVHQQAPSRAANSAQKVPTVLS
jgi:hypothetical protein